MWTIIWFGGLTLLIILTHLWQSRKDYFKQHRSWMIAVVLFSLALSLSAISLLLLIPVTIKGCNINGHRIELVNRIDKINRQIEWLKCSKKYYTKHKNKDGIEYVLPHYKLQEKMYISLELFKKLSKLNQEVNYFNGTLKEIKFLNKYIGDLFISDKVSELSKLKSICRKCFYYNTYSCRNGFYYRY